MCDPVVVWHATPRMSLSAGAGVHKVVIKTRCIAGWFSMGSGRGACMKSASCVQTRNELTPMLLHSRYSWPKKWARSLWRGITLLASQHPDRRVRHCIREQASNTSARQHDTQGNFTNRTRRGSKAGPPPGQQQTRQFELGECVHTACVGAC